VDIITPSLTRILMDERLVFIKLIGAEDDNYYRYEFMFSTDIEEFDIEEDNEHCCLSETIRPITETVTHYVKTKLKLDLVQDNCCFSFEHAKLGIVALGWENMDSYDEYPKDGRIFFKFGETIEDVEDKLAVKGILIID